MLSPFFDIDKSSFLALLIDMNPDYVSIMIGVNDAWRSLAVLVMTLLLVMVFIIPIALLVNSIVRERRKEPRRGE